MPNGSLAGRAGRGARGPGIRLSIRELVRAGLPNALRGFCMGTADVVPGVSGGTIALILGIYERLVHAIRSAAGVAVSLLRRDPAPVAAYRPQIEWMMNNPLVVGQGLAIVTLARLLEYLLEEHPEALSAFFFGLVAGSILIVWRFIRRPNPSVHLPLAAAVAVGAFFLLGLRSSAIDDPSTGQIFFAAMIAICAMILPGISGSFILLMLGMYDAVIAAVNDRDIGFLAVFAAGAALGLGAFAWLLDWLLKRFHDLMMAALAGLMLGSLRVLWPWPEGTDSGEIEAPPAGEWAVPLAVGVAGLVVVLALWWVSRSPRFNGSAPASD